MANTTLVILAVTVLVASCSAEAPLFRKSKVFNKNFVLFQRQELPLEDSPAPEVEVAVKAPYPPAGVTPETPFELPTETTAAPELSQEYGPPSQEYGPPAIEEVDAPVQEYGTPVQEYGPPAIEEVVIPSEEYGPPIIEDGTPVDEVIEREVIEGDIPQPERLVVYRVPARLIRRPSVRVLRLKH